MDESRKFNKRVGGGGGRRPNKERGGQFCFDILISAPPPVYSELESNKVIYTNERQLRCSFLSYLT